MSQSEMIYAGVQIEAARELGEMIQPLIQRIVRSAHRLSLKNKSAAQPEVFAQGTTHSPIAHIQVQDG
jgi:hypothetical protein